MMTEIHTAVPFENQLHDLEQPLIGKTDQESVSADNDKQEKKAHTCWITDVLTTWTFVNGFWLGFMIQTISLGSTAILAIKWGKPATWATKQDEFYYFIFFILSQSWWLLFPIICYAIDGGLVANGKSIFERCFYPCADVPARDVFLGGVRFHVGIVFGCFLVWTMIDFYFGASLTVFITLFVSFISCLGLCYGMVVIHDKYILEQEQQQEEASSTTPCA